MTTKTIDMSEGSYTKNSHAEETEVLDKVAIAIDINSYLLIKAYHLDQFAPPFFIGA
jgi:hypothetical protein